MSDDGKLLKVIHCHENATYIIDDTDTMKRYIDHYYKERVVTGTIVRGTFEFPPSNIWRRMDINIYDYMKKWGEFPEVENEEHYNKRIEDEERLKMEQKEFEDKDKNVDVIADCGEMISLNFSTVVGRLVKGDFISNIKHFCFHHNVECNIDEDKGFLESILYVRLRGQRQYIEHIKKYIRELGE